MNLCLQKFFQFRERETSWRIEFIAGVTSFLTMAYVIVVNPGILSSTGMNEQAIFVATCLAAALGCIAMGLLSNYPLGVAPSMGLNAYFAFTVVQQMGYSWQVGLGAVLCSGILFALLTFFGIRQQIIYLIPMSLKIGIAAGIGLFLGVIALKNIGLLTVFPHFAVNFVTLTKLSTVLAILGVGLIFLLKKLRIPGAILIGIVVITMADIALGISTFKGIFSWPPSIKPTLFAFEWPDFTDTKLLMVVFIFFFVALFDSIGTMIAVLQQGKLVQPDGSIPRITQALFVDSMATTTGALLGTSTSGVYIESSAGVNAGGKTGVTAIVIGLFFLAALFFAPLAETIPVYATAPALIYVAILMARSLAFIKHQPLIDKIAALVTTFTIPLTFSIADGISYGVITYVVLKLIAGKIRQVHPLLCCLAVILGTYLVHELFF